MLFYFIKCNRDPIVFPFFIFFSLVVAVGANNRGRSFTGFLLLSLMLSPLIGGLVLFVLGANETNVENKSIDSGDSKKCPFCAETIKIDAVVCRFCGRALPKIGFNTNSNNINLDSDDIEKYSSKEEWLNMRIMELISNNMNPSDAKIQAETEYSINKQKLDRKQKEELEKQKIIEEKQRLLSEFKSSDKKFNFDEHLEILKSFTTIDELLEYLNSLEIKEEYFPKTVIPEIVKIKDLERLYGNMYKTAIAKLEELTKLI